MPGGGGGMAPGGSGGGTGGPSGSEGGSGPMQGGSGGGSGGAPQEAIDACDGLSSGSSCSFTGPGGSVSGTCTMTGSSLSCFPGF